MNEQEIQEVLDELHKVRPEKLNDKGKRLFNAIMSITDERDLYKQRIDKAIELIEADYFEDGSGENIEKVLDILKGRDKEWIKK